MDNTRYMQFEVREDCFFVLAVWPSKRTALCEDRVVEATSNAAGLRDGRHR